MYLQLSNLYIASSSAIMFKNNIALDHGEALYLDESKIYIIPNANVTFANNRAYNKGAMELSTLNLAYITLNQILSQNDPHKCFHHPWSEISNNESAYIKFTNNSARSVGDHIYGASLDEYKTETNPEIYKYSNLSSNSSSISLDPLRICICFKNHDGKNVPQRNKASMYV